ARQQEDRKRMKILALAAGATIVMACTAVNATSADGAGALTTTPIDVYGAWHCGNDYCTWSTVRGLAEFDQKNHWLIDRGDGRPAVNLVVLSFVHPMRLLD